MTILIILGVLALVLGVAFAVVMTRRAESATVASRPELVVDPALSATSKEDKLRVIAEASDVMALRRAWTAWRSRGLADGGQIHLLVLDRLEELGDTLSEHEMEVRAKGRAAVRRGRELPPIHGHGFKRGA